MLANSAAAALVAALVAASLRFATPLLLGALGELFTERAGILNLGIEGVMLGGAFAAFMTVFATGDLTLGFLAALLAGLLLGLLLGFWYITLRTNQIVTAMVFNFMMVGLTGYGYRLLVGTERLTTLDTMKTVAIPLLRDIPLIGETFFDQSPLTYLALLLVPVASVVLYRTAFGLSLRAVGEHPRAADTMGVDVRLRRYTALAIGCVGAGAGGAFFALAFGAFMETMVSGRGYIALAVVIFGRWKPGRILAGAVLFGLVDALAFVMQAHAVPVPSQFLLMMPYVLTIMALLLSIRSRAEVGSPTGPKALATPYEREG